MPRGSISSPSSQLRSAEDDRGSTPRARSKRRLLYLEEWLSLAVTSPRVPTLEDRLPLLPRVEDQRHLRETQRGAARALADMLGQEPAPQRRDSRLPVGKDHRRGRRTTRLRRRQEGSRQEASPTGGHRGTGPQSQGTQREDP